MPPPSGWKDARVALDPVENFRRLATEYCSLIENVEAAAGGDVLERLCRLLPALLVAAENLPDREPGTEQTAPGIAHETWAERFNAALGSKVAYWTTREVVAQDEPEVFCLNLADDLADIWRDLKGPLLLLEDGGDEADAVWQWRFSATTHWGTHAVEAIRAVHSLTR